MSQFVMEGLDNFPTVCWLTNYSPRGYSTLLGPFVEVPVANKVLVRRFPKFPKFIVRQVGRPLWEKVGVDVVFMPETSDGYKFIVFARDDLSGWVEGRALKENTARNVAKFLYEDVICRHGCPRRIIIDGGSENKSVAKVLLERYRVQRTVVSAYHPQSNGLVERGHDAVVNSLQVLQQRTGKMGAISSPCAMG